MSPHPDFHDFLEALNKNRVEFVLVGAYALAFHGHPRATGDMDVWVKPTAENARRVLAALRDFGFSSLALKEGDFLSGKVIQLGHPPVRIDILSALDGVSPEHIWTHRRPGALGDIPVSFLSREDLIATKRAVGRHQDLADVESLEQK
ncbi:MAG: hypothetical protein WC969_03080 [Elusimicrobiota bacterium]|jgi:hypothetical protein